MPGVLLLMKLTLSSFLTPLGNENGLGCFHNTYDSGDYLSRSYLYELETVPQLSQVSRAHFEGLMMSLLFLYSTYHSVGN